MNENNAKKKPSPTKKTKSQCDSIRYCSVCEKNVRDFDHYFLISYMQPSTYYMKYGLQRFYFCPKCATEHLPKFVIDEAKIMYRNSQM